MNRHPFRAVVRGAALAFIGIAVVAQLSGCTAPRGPAQEQRAVVATLPAPSAAPAAPEVQAPPPAPPTPAQQTTEGRAKVALLVPLTGVNKSIGQAMLDAGNMALFEVSADIALLPRDTGSSPDNARAAAQQAMADNAGLILGPVFSNAVPPVRALLDGSEVSAISFSTDATIAGGNAFVLGFLPAQQVNRVIAFARSRGMTKLAALVPDNAYGEIVSAEISKIRDQLAMPAPRIITLAPRDFRSQLEPLAEDPPEMLLVAIGGDELHNLAPALGEFKAAHPVQILGTGLWDDASLATVPALAGAWYVASPPGGFASFASRFQQTYNYAPPRIASLAYDAVALSAAIARGAPGNLMPFSRDVLLQPNGFLGMDGAFRFLPSGLSERNLAVLSISPDGPLIIDPPNPSFEALTN